MQPFQWHSRIMPNMKFNMCRMDKDEELKVWETLHHAKNEYKNYSRPDVPLLL